ncbi:MAG TPA: hypothetical protein VJX30_10205 [Terriglobales bacterium]|nr:hypothetical protein [Terriglobales bacterium]
MKIRRSQTVLRNKAMRPPSSGGFLLGNASNILTVGAKGVISFLAITTPYVFLDGFSVALWRTT